MHGFPAALMYYTRKEASNCHEERSKNQPQSINAKIVTTLKQLCCILQKGTFWCFVVNNFGCLMVGDSGRLFLADRAKDEGLTELEYMTVSSLWGVTTLLSRLTAGPLFINPRRRILSLIAVLIFWGLLYFSFVFIRTFWSMCIYSLLFGWCDGVVAVLYYLVFADIFAADQIAMTFGCITTIDGVAVLILVPFAGRIYDITGSYDYVYFFIGGCSFLSAIATMFLYFIVHYESITNAPQKSSESINM